MISLDATGAELRSLRHLGDHVALERCVESLPDVELPCSAYALEVIQSRIVQGHLTGANNLCKAVVQREAHPVLVAEARLVQAILTVYLEGNFAAASKGILEVQGAFPVSDDRRYIQARAQVASCQLIAMESIYLLRNSHELRDACDRLERLAQNFEELDELEEAAVAWSKLGHYCRLGDAPNLVRARTALETTIDKARTWGFPTLEAQALVDLGDLLFENSATREQGLRLLERAQVVFDNVGHRYGHWDVVRIRANHRNRLGEDATDDLLRCRDAYAQQDQLRLLQSVLMALSTWNLRCGRTREARRHSEDAAEVGQRMGSIFGEVAGRLTIADAFARKGEYSQAINEYETLLENDPPAVSASQVRMLLANAHLAASDTEKAAQLLWRVHGGALEMGDLATASLAAVNLANTYNGSGRLDRASEVLEEWIPRDSARGALFEAAQKHCMLGDMLVQEAKRQDPGAMKPWIEPEAHYRETLQLGDGLEGLEARLLSVDVSQSLANLHLLRGESLPALEKIDRTIELYQGLDMRFQAANSTLLKGLVHYELATRQGVRTSFGEAESALGFALEFFVEAEVHTLKQQARYLLAQLASRATSFAASPEGREHMLELVWRLLEEYESDDRRARLGLVLRDVVATQEARLKLRVKEDIYRFAIEVSALVENEPARSLDWLERQKSRVFLEALMQTPLRYDANRLPGRFVEHEEALLRKIRYAAGDREAFALTAEVEALYEDAESHGHNSEYLHLRRGRPLEEKQIFELLDTSSVVGVDEGRQLVLVEYFLRDEDVWVFIVDPRRGCVERYVVEVRRSDLVRFVTMTFEDRGDPRWVLNEGAPVHLHQFDDLVAPLAKCSEAGDVIYLIPHGELHLLPLHALQIEGQALIERNPVAYAPSATVLKFCQAKRKLDASGKPSLSSAAVFGDPTGDRPDNVECARTVADLFSTRPVEADDATIKAFERKTRSVDVVHFQGHAECDFAEPLGSCLLMGRGEVLTARRLFETFRLDASLVSLGACWTGYSKVEPGDELMGLVRALIYAGTPSVLATLWPVHEESTAFFMERFYRTLLDPATPSSKVDALRSAMLETRAARPAWQAVYHWAPFVLIGDWL